jgi:hypothetical protein
MGLAAPMGGGLMHVLRRVGTATLLMLFAAATAGAATAAAGGAARQQVLVVAGLGGEPAWEEAFTAAASGIADGARAAGHDCVLLHGDAASASGIVGAIAAAAASLAAGDAFVFVFVGHGSYDGETFRLNVPGHDLDAEALRAALAGIRARRQAIVLATSSSGAVADTLAAPGRLVLTATRSGGERTASDFGSLFAASLATGAADIDKNGRLSIDEAYAYAEARLRADDVAAGRLATAHPQRTGDDAPGALVLGRLVAAAGSRPADASEAAGGSPDAGTPPAADAHADERAALEEAVAALRARRAELSVDEYYQRLEALLLQLAELPAAAR